MSPNYSYASAFDSLSLWLSQNTSDVRQDILHPSIRHFHPAKCKYRNANQDDLRYAELSFLNTLIYRLFLDKYKQSRPLANAKQGRPCSRGLYEFYCLGWFSVLFPFVTHAISLTKPSVQKGEHLRCNLYRILSFFGFLLFAKSRTIFGVANGY